ncbi:MAG: Primosomal protein N' [Chlamydiae bacterium]|nr:Primosomal protein N' [Chlamydiota bacterium]
MPTGSPTVALVILDDALDRPLDYAIPEELLGLQMGTRVQVPLQKRSAKGTILALKRASKYPNLRFIEKALSDEPLISPELFTLADWISKYYLAPLTKVLKSILPPPLRNEKGRHKMQSFVKPLQSKEKLRTLCEELRKKHPAQAKILDQLLQAPKGLLLSEILEKAAVSVSPIKTLAKKEILSLQEIQIDRSPIFKYEFFPTKPKILSPEQKNCLEQILKSLGRFQPHLIYGVTGSGKTEIYLQAIDSVLKEGKGVIYLVPEIALTSQTIERFKGRFGGENIAILHHRLSDGERYDTWHKIRSGAAKIAIGARSAIFSPVPNLGLIVVDEEHESAYKQSDEAPKYHARDVAVMRSKLASCPILLGSATPSLESYTNALKGKYELHILKNRHGNAKLPNVKIIDMVPEFEKAKGFTLFSDPLLQGIKTRLEKGEQVLLFLNRRGYHTSASCTVCPYVVKCPDCELTLTYHRGESTLACHLCDYRIPPPRSCPECNKEGPLKFKGVGTEMVEKALHALFPTIRSLRLDADTTRHKGAHDKIFRSFRSGKADVLIGTQMIAKGLHFPLVTLVGVINADGSLNIPDFRASENVFQLLTQVAGRAGRGDLPGTVIIQTRLPENPILRLASSQDFEGFYTEEIETRDLFAFPPFTHLVKFSFSGEDPGQCEEVGKEIRSFLVAHLSKEEEILPVVPCGYAKIKRKYRYQCLVKGKKIFRILPVAEKAKAAFGRRGGVRLSIEVDPQSTYF